MDKPVVGTIRQLTNEETSLMQTAMLRSTTLDATCEIMPIAKLKELCDWMREPDYVENASLEWFMDWVNRRPLSALYGLK